MSTLAGDGAGSEVEAGLSAASNTDATPFEPTPDMYGELGQAFAWFNRTLFEGRLPPVMLALARKANSCGWYNHAQWVNGVGRRSGEITLNPSYFAVRSILSTLAEFVGQMLHAAQHEFGKPGRPKSGGHYHNIEYAEMAEALGLITTDDGTVGGARRGESVTFIIIEGGKFERSASELLTDTFTMSWLDRFPTGRPGEHEMRRMTPAELEQARAALKTAPAPADEDDEDAPPSPSVAFEMDADRGADRDAGRNEDADGDEGHDGARMMRLGGEEETKDWLDADAAGQEERRPLMAASEAVREAIQLQADTPKAPPKRVKYSCPGCKKAYWGARGGDLTCNPCQAVLIEIEPGAGKRGASSKDEAASEDDAAMDQAA